MSIGVQPCCCVNCVAAVDDAGMGGTYPLDPCFSSGAATDPVWLSKSRIAFIGPFQLGAGPVYNVPAPLQVAIKAWVIAGGRLVLTSNPTATFDSGGTGNTAAYNAFLGFLGSGMQLSGANIPFGCPPSIDCAVATSAAIGIMNGLAAPLNYALGGEITGGTVLARTSTTVFPFAPCTTAWPVMAIEQIGAGLVVATGSSYILGGACGDNCELYKRLCNWSITRILAP